LHYFDLASRLRESPWLKLVWFIADSLAATADRFIKSHMRYTLPVYEFGHFRLDPAERVLSCDGKPVHLTLKAFTVLLVLIEKAGHVVEKHELMLQVWPDAFVEEANLTQSIALARRALCECHDRHKYIETVHRRGYRFIAVVNVRERIPAEDAVTDRHIRVADGTRGLGRSAASAATERKQDLGAVISQDVCEFGKFENGYTDSVSAEANHLYMRGRRYWGKYTVEGLLKGINHFRAATKIDPNFALAFSGLADCYYRLSNIYLHPNEAMPKARSASMNALGLDKTLGETHALLGLIRTFYERDWRAAETEFKRSIELAVDCALVHNRYGWALGMLGHFDAAIAEMKEALRLAPFSSELHVGFGIILHLARLEDLAIGEAHLALDIEPDFYAAHTLLGMAYAQQRRLGEAVTELQEAASLAHVSWTLGYLGYACGISGQRQRAFDLLFELAQRSRQNYVSPYTLALIHAGLGDKEQALLCLENAYEDRNEMFGFVKTSPEFDGLRAEERFTNLLRRNTFSARAS
jgi:DNA-binding winged helix-turn-helix (wHTH) protein/Flp pilus assembly protein TadD